MPIVQEETAMRHGPVIAIVCDAISPYSHGGRERRYEELLPWLAEGAEVHIYTMHWWDGPPVYTEGGITYHAISPSLPLYTENRRSIIHALRFGLASLSLLRHRFDVLEADHIPYLQVFALRIVSWLKRKPFIVTWHEVWSRAVWWEYLGWLGMVAWPIELLAMRLPDLIIAASPETAERLHAILGERAAVTTVPNGINVSDIRDVCADAASTDLVVVGRLIKHKRVDMVLDAVAQLHAQGLHVTCRIIGDGPEWLRLRNQAERLGILPSVDFRRDVSEQKELYALVKAARLFVSLSAREGFGIAVLEAIACEVPVLTTYAPDNYAQYLVQRYVNGIVVEPTLEAVVAGTRALLGEAGNQVEIAGDVADWVADYDWSALAARLGVI